MIRRYIFLLMALMCAFVLAAKSMAQDTRTDVGRTRRFYQTWEHMTSRQLLDQGFDYMERDEHYDSMAVCYSIVANRYYEHPDDEETQKNAILAFNSLGFIYRVFYHEYPKSYSQYLIAKKIATDNHLDEILPEINLNIVNLNRSRYVLEANDGYRDTLISQYREVFYDAIDKGIYSVITLCMMNIVSLANEDSLEHTIVNEMDTFDRIVFPPEEQTPQYRYAQIQLRGARKFMQKDYEGALDVYEGLLDMEVVKNRTIQEVHEFNYHVMRATAFMVMKRYDDMMGEINVMERLGRTSKTPECIMSAYHAKLQFYDKLVPHPDSCKKYQLEYLLMKDSLLNRKKLNTLKETEFLFQLNVANEQIRTQIVEQRTQRTVMRVVGAVAVLLALVGLVLWRSFRSVKRKNEQLYEKNLELLDAMQEKKEMKQKYQGVYMSDETKETLLQKIISVMETDDGIYDADFSLSRLAGLVGADHHYVSQVINEKQDHNFAALLNHYRISEACRRMNDVEHYGHLTIEAIAAGVGFRSRSYFVKVFKEQTGLTPSSYLRLAKNRHAGQA